MRNVPENDAILLGWATLDEMHGLDAAGENDALGAIRAHDRAVELAASTELPEAVALGEALACFDDAIRALERLTMSGGLPRRVLGIAHANRANALERVGKRGEALENHRWALEILDRASGGAASRHHAAVVHRNHGRALLRAGQPHAAARSCSRAVELLEGLGAPDRPGPLRGELGVSLLDLAEAHRHAGDDAAAGPTFDSAARCLEPEADEAETNAFGAALVRAHLGVARSRRAVLGASAVQPAAVARLASLGQGCRSVPLSAARFAALIAAAANELRTKRGLRVCNPLGEPRPFPVVDSYLTLGLGPLLAAADDEVESHAARAVALCRQLVGPAGRRELEPMLALARYELASVLFVRGQLSQAALPAGQATEALETLSRPGGREDLRTELMLAHAVLALVVDGLGQAERARCFAERAEEVRRELETRTISLRDIFF